MKDLKDRKLYAVEKLDTYSVLKPLIRDAVDTAAFVDRWAELLRARASIDVGAAAPSTILRKLAATGPNNALFRALQALGRVECTLFTLLTAAIVPWNTIYLDEVVQQLRAQGVSIPDELLAHVAPLGWEHIVLTGDYD